MNFDIDVLVFSVRARGRRGRLLDRTLSKTLSYNRHEFEITENENGSINFKENSPPIRGERFRGQFPPNFFDFLKRVLNFCRQRLRSISRSNDSCSLQSVFKYLRVPEILL